MDSASQYLSMSEPDKSNHLWKYTPWRRIHPTGKITEIPELASATLSLSMMDGSEIPPGVSLVRGSGGDLDLSMDNALTNSFFMQCRIHPTGCLLLRVVSDSRVR